ncbi:hypothetical protein BDV93DRAFT_511385 [Ceratobasidium sp. AG-I]|nr:hypothetical protein BDV93DRAFT_511385 [Ceratobasidium sp. AG-I]
MNDTYGSSIEVHKIVFPAEILPMICASLAFEDLRAVAVTSWHWWGAACPILWQNVYRLEFLLHALFGDSFEHLSSSEPGSPDDNKSEQEPPLVGGSFDPRNLSIDSFDRITPCIQALNIYRSLDTRQLNLTGGLAATLAARAASSPLLPNLRSLSIRELRWPHRSLPLGPSDTRHFDLVSLFLSSSLVRLAISYNPSVIDIATLKNRTPSIQELILSIDEPPRSMFSSSIQATWRHSAMVGWENLTTLRCNSKLLDVFNLVTLGKFKSLESLLILGDRHRRWEGLRFEHGSFSRLKTLCLQHLPLEDAHSFFHRSESMPSLRTLEISVRHGNYIGDGLVARICWASPNIQKLGFYPYNRPTAKELQPLEKLSLKWLDLSGVYFANDVTSVLLGLHAGLEHLAVNKLKTPVKFLKALAERYPNLHWLELLFVVRDVRDLPKRALETLASSPLRFHYTLATSAGDIFSAAEVAAAQTALVEYAGSLWQNVTARLVINEYRRVRLCDGCTY